MVQYRMSTKKYIFYILFISILSTGGSIAHDWYPSNCCSDSDCHPVDCASLEDKDKEIIYKGFYFSDNMIKPSQDGLCHVCISNEHSQEFTPVPHCVFVQLGT